MKKSKIFLACVGAVAILGSNLAVAGNRPEAVTISGGDAYYHPAAKRKMDTFWMPNIAAAYNFDDHWAAEAGVGLINTNTHTSNPTPNRGVHGFLYTANALYRVGQFGRFEPYAIAGVGLLNMRPNGNSSEHQGNVNAGVGTQFFATDSIAFRAEARDLYTMSGGKNDYMLNIGMSFLFGGKTAQPVVVQKTDLKAEKIDFKAERARSH